MTLIVSHMILFVIFLPCVIRNAIFSDKLTMSNQAIFLVTCGLFSLSWLISDHIIESVNSNNRLPTTHLGPRVQGPACPHKHVMLVIKMVTIHVR